MAFLASPKMAPLRKTPISSPTRVFMTAEPETNKIMLSNFSPHSKPSQLHLGLIKIYS